MFRDRQNGYPSPGSCFFVTEGSLFVHEVDGDKDDGGERMHHWQERRDQIFAGTGRHDTMMLSNSVSFCHQSFAVVNASDARFNSRGWVN